MRNQTLALAAISAISALALSVHAQTYNWTLSTIHAEGPGPFNPLQNAGHGSGSGTITFASVPYGTGTIVTGFTGFLNLTGTGPGSSADQVMLDPGPVPPSTYATDFYLGNGGIFLEHDNASVYLNLHQDPGGDWHLEQYYTALGSSTLDGLTWHVNFTVVPEPHEYAAVACAGLVGFGLWRRRAQRAVQA